MVTSAAVARVIVARPDPHEGFFLAASRHRAVEPRVPQRVQRRRHPRPRGHAERDHVISTYAPTRGAGLAEPLDVRADARISAEPQPRELEHAARTEKSCPLAGAPGPHNAASQRVALLDRAAQAHPRLA